MTTTAPTYRTEQARRQGGVGRILYHDTEVLYGIRPGHEQARRQPPRYTSESGGAGRILYHDTGVLYGIRPGRAGAPARRRPAGPSPEEPRRFAGLAVPYGVATRIFDGPTGYAEKFCRGCFAEAVGRGVPICRNHNRRVQIGRTTKMWETDAGLHVEFTIESPRDAESIRRWISIGGYGMSVGFTPVVDRYTTSVVERIAGRLVEISLGQGPAYPGTDVCVA